MLLQLRREVDVREHVAVQDEQALLEQALVVREPHRAGRAERDLLVDVAQPHAALDVAEHVVYGVREEAEREDRLVDTVTMQPVEHERQERAARQRQHRLRRRQGQRPQPRALAPGEDERLH